MSIPLSASFVITGSISVSVSTRSPITMVALPSARKASQEPSTKVGLSLDNVKRDALRSRCAAIRRDRRRRAFPCRTCRGSDHAPVGFSGRAGERGKADDTCDSGASKVQKAARRMKRPRDGLINIDARHFCHSLLLSNPIYACRTQLFGDYVALNAASLSLANRAISVGAPARELASPSSH